MAKNFELMYKVFRYIENNRDRWNQASWVEDPSGGDTGTIDKMKTYAEDPLNPSCKTTGCFAGWTVLLSGYRPHVATSHFLGSGTEYAYLDDLYVVPPGKNVMDITAVETIPKVARDLLGITQDEANLLFHPYNTMDEMYAVVAGWEDEELTKAVDERIATELAAV